MEIFSASHFGAEWSALLVFGCCMLPIAWLFGFTAWRIALNLRLARDAEREHPATRLVPGPAVLAGKVVRGGGKAVRVEIDQKGTSYKVKSKWRHRFSEIARRVIAEPFELELASGERVAVVPDEKKVFLVDQLDKGRRLGAPDDVRTRTAELSEGEHVYIVGALEEGDPDPKATAGNYREAPVRKLVMRAPRGGRMLIASERLGRRYRGRMWFHARWCFYALVVFAVVHGGLFLGYHLRLFAGHAIGAEVTRVPGYTVRGRRSSTTYHNVYVTGDDDGTRVVLDARSSSYRALRQGDRIELRVVDGWPDMTALGAAPTASFERGLWIMGALLLIIGAYLGNRQSSRPWYDKPIIVDEGDGALPTMLRELP